MYEQRDSPGYRAVIVYAVVLLFLSTTEQESTTEQKILGYIKWNYFHNAFCSFANAVVLLFYFNNRILAILVEQIHGAVFGNKSELFSSVINKNAYIKPCGF